jgi:acyl dehydratase
MSTYTQPALFVGMQETFSRVITEGETALYAGLVGDNRRQVFDNSSGKVANSSRQTAHQLFLVGVIGGLLNTRNSFEGAHCISMQYEFITPYFCGDRIDILIELSALDLGKHLATFRINCHNQDKNQVLTGQAVLLVPAQILPKI